MEKSPLTYGAAKDLAAHIRDMAEAVSHDAGLNPAVLDATRARRTGLAQRDRGRPLRRRTPARTALAKFPGAVRQSARAVRRPWPGPGVVAGDGPPFPPTEPQPLPDVGGQPSPDPALDDIPGEPEKACSQSSPWFSLRCTQENGRPLTRPAVGCCRSVAELLPAITCCPRLRRFLAAVLRIVRVRSSPSSPSFVGACGAWNRLRRSFVAYFLRRFPTPCPGG